MCSADLEKLVYTVAMFTYKIREAKIADHEAVKEISRGIYQDTDFTPNIFLEWVADDQWLPFVAETILGQVVGFLALNITDGGESVVVRSSRVAEEFRGHGIYKQLLNSALKFASAKLARLTCIIRARPAHIRVPAGYKVIKTTSKIIISCTPKSVDAVPLPKIPGALLPVFQEHHLTVSEFMGLYDQHAHFKDLFTGDMLTIEGETFHLSNAANRESLEKRNDIFFTYTKYPIEMNKNGAVFSVLCASSKVTNENKIYVTLNIFGKESAMVGYHILKAMKTATLLVGCDFNIGLFVDVELEGPILEFVKEELEFCKTLWQRQLKLQVATLESHYL